MITYRIKYKNTISELFLPKRHNGKTIIFLPGLPSFLGKNNLTSYLTANGFVVFQPFYSGSFDSKGVFSPQQCLNDVKVFTQMAKQKKFKELYFNKNLSINTKEVILVGISFGTSIAVLAADKLIDIGKLVLISPILTYQEQTYNDYGFKNVKFDKRMVSLLSLLKQAYPYSYRIKNFKTWQEFLLGKNKTYNPVAVLGKNQSKKIFLIHGKNDKSIPYQFTQKIFKDKLNKKYNRLNIIRKAGHSLSSFDNNSFKNIVNFINEK